MFISVIVPTYNRRNILERTLQALINQRLPQDRFEIIVVDDCSLDDTAEYLECMSQTHANLRCVLHKQNQGRAVTRNDGITLAQGELVILLDDDNVPEQDFIAKHLAYHLAYGDEKIAVMGNVSYASEVIEGKNFARYQQSRYLGNRSLRDRKGIDYQDLPPRCLGTCNCSIRKDDLLAIGMLDPIFRYYGGEDEYLGHCLHGIGVKIIFGSEASSIHYDQVNIARYKLKVGEYARFGIRNLLIKDATYFEGTQIRYLLPIDRDHDSIRRICVKILLRVLLNPITTYVLERWAILTDRYSQVYWQPLYRLLLAAWVLELQRSGFLPVPLVTYDPEMTQS